MSEPLIPLRLKGRGQFDYPDDVRRIVAAYAALGYHVDDADAAFAWERYSEEYYCAGWLGMYPGDDLFACTEEYFAIPERES